jgi:hypothetical protein
MAEGAQAESEKAPSSRDKAPKPALSPEGGIFEGALAFAPAQAGLSNMLGGADPRQRSREVLRLQRLHGNAFVQRLMKREQAEKESAATLAASRISDSEAPAATNAKEAPVFPADGTYKALNAGQVSWSKHAQFPTVMGQTYYARKDIEIWPSYRTKWDSKWAARVQKTDAAGGVWNATATPQNEEGYKMPDERAEYPGYEVYIRESGAAAELVAAAEQQHINDIDTGWAITGLAARDAINQIADEEPKEKDTEMEAKKATADKVAAKMGPLGAKIRGALDSQGRLEDALGPLMDNAVRQSVKQRDDTGKHTIPVRYVMKDDQKKRVLYEVNEDFKLDKTASEAVVNIGTIG